MNHIHNKLATEYNQYITGSDQVWNPNFNRMSDIDFLKFSPKEKRSSFSASFGISEIPEELKEYYKNNLLEMQNLSVREDRGKEIIEELTGRKDAEVLIDPTMMLIAEEWDKVSKKPRKLTTDKYILNYFLGNLSEKRRKEIEKVATQNGCTIINLMDKNDQLYASGPSEFLYLVKNAFMICTDSYHGSIFSIIYNKPFVVFDREDNIVNMNSRLETLLSKFQLQERYSKDGKIPEELLQCDYTESYKILELEKEKTNEYIEKILNNSNDEKNKEASIERKKSNKNGSYIIICHNCSKHASWNIIYTNINSKTRAIRIWIIFISHICYFIFDNIGFWLWKCNNNLYNKI